MKCFTSWEAPEAETRPSRLREVLDRFRSDRRDPQRCVLDHVFADFAPRKQVSMYVSVPDLSATVYLFSRSNAFAIKPHERVVVGLF